MMRHATLCALGAAAMIMAAGTVDGQEQMTIVALGDSTTAGTPGFASPVESPPEGRGNPESQYAYWIMRRHPEWRVLNRGVNGERTDEIERRFARDVSAAHPRAVIILAGVNDIYQGASVERVTDGLRRLYERAAKEHLTVVACSILPYGGIPHGKRDVMAKVNAWIRAYTAERGLLFCDTASAVTAPEAPWRLAGSPDGLHPDVAGYRAMGDALASVLERARTP